MKVSGKGIAAGLAFEFLPALIFGSALAFAGSRALAASRFDSVPLLAGAVAFGVCWLSLRRFGAGAESLPMADFDQSDLERELAKLAGEMQCAGVLENRGVEDEPGELLLDEELRARSSEEPVPEKRLQSFEGDSQVIRLFDPKSESAGEMQKRIDRHLRDRSRPQLSDATQELHEALSALRQSLR